MTDPIVSLERIKQEAQQAAGKFANVNDACPYPFNSAAGREFKAEFEWCRRVIEAHQNPETAP